MSHTQQVQNTKNGTSKTNLKAKKGRPPKNAATEKGNENFKATEEMERNELGIAGAPANADPNDPMGLNAAASVLDPEPRGAVINPMDDDKTEEVPIAEPKDDYRDVTQRDAALEIHEFEELGKEHPAKTLNDMESKVSFAKVQGVGHFFAVDRVLQYFNGGKVPTEGYLMYKGVRVYSVGANVERIEKKEKLSVNSVLFQKSGY